MKNPLNDKEKTTYSCNGFTITGDCSAQRNKLCTKDVGSCISSNNGNSPRTTKRPILQPKDQKIAKMVVNMGTDGTRDDVKMKICSEDNTVCCTSDKLSHLLSREWQENKQETWEAGKFGSKCKKQVFKVNVLKWKNFKICLVLIHSYWVTNEIFITQTFSSRFQHIQDYH